MIADYLKQGKENRVTFEELKELTGIYETRQLRKAISDERKEGMLILSTSKGGYFLPANDEEIKDYIRYRMKETYEVYKSLKPATKALKVDLNQITMMIEEREEIC